MKRGYRLLFLSYCILVILIIPMTSLAILPKTAFNNNQSIDEPMETADDWLSGWQYRKAYVISSTPGAGVNYQIEIKVHFADGMDSDNSVYLGSKCQADFDDIRFTGNDGVTLLDYWRENYVDWDFATFWVEIRDDLTSDVAIFMYYGNSICASLSNGTATFIFFDDYENNNLDRWDGTTGAGYSCATDQVANGLYALKFSGSPGADIFKNLTDNGAALSHDFMVHSWVRDDNQVRGGHVPLVKSSSQMWVYACRGYGSQFSYFQGGADYVHWPTNYSGASDAWFEINVGFSMSTDKMRAWKNGSYMGELNLIAANGVSVPDDLFQLGFGQQSDYVTWWDDTYVRKWTPNEPTVTIWSDEEPVRRIWHHDCSNTTGWVIDPSPPFTMLGYVQDGVDLLSDGDALYSDTLPNYVTDSHGVEYFYELSEPIAINRGLNLSVLLNHPGTADRMGGVMVGVFNATKYPILWVEIQDGWYSSTWYTLVRAIDAYEAAPQSGPWTGYLKVWYNDSSNDIQGQDNVNTYTLLESGDYNPEMEVAYVGLVFLNKQSYTYESCRVLDISLEYTSEPVLTEDSWNHDCSNTTGFTYNDQWDMSWYPWSITSGALSSDGDSLSISGIPVGSGYHGPVFEYELPSSFNIDDLGSFNVTLFADNSAASYVGTCYVMLGDADRDLILSASVHDGWLGSSQGSYGAQYIFKNKTRVGFGSGYPVIWTGFSGEMSLRFDPLQGIVAYVEGKGEQLLIQKEVVESDREIMYVAIGVARYGSDTPIPVSVDSISLTTVAGTDTTSPSINHPMDITYEYGTTGHFISWSVSDLNPGTYNITCNDDPIRILEDWSPGSISTNIDDLDLGAYTYIIHVEDEFGNEATDTVIVTVEDTTAPNLNHPSDIVLDFGTPSIRITWRPTDLLPNAYQMYQNGTLITTNIWHDGDNLTYTVPQGLAPGEYEITIIVDDTSGNSASDTVFITIQEVLIPDIGGLTIIGITIGSIAVIVVIGGLVCRSRIGGSGSEVSDFTYG